MAKEKKGEKLNQREKQTNNFLHNQRSLQKNISTIPNAYYHYHCCLQEKEYHIVGRGDLYKIIPPPPYGYITLAILVALIINKCFLNLHFDLILPCPHTPYLPQLTTIVHYYGHNIRDQLSRLFFIGEMDQFSRFLNHHMFPCLMGPYGFVPSSRITCFPLSYSLEIGP